MVICRRLKNVNNILSLRDVLVVQLNGPYLCVQIVVHSEFLLNFVKIYIAIPPIIFANNFRDGYLEQQSIQLRRLNNCLTANVLPRNGRHSDIPPEAMWAWTDGAALLFLVTYNSFTNFIQNCVFGCHD